MTITNIAEYLRSLKEGEKVVETTVSSCMYGKQGTVYISEEPMTLGSVCVLWEGGMGTSATWGTRRLSDATEFLNRLDPMKTAEEWYSEEESFQWLNRRPSPFDSKDESRRVPVDVFSREFAVWFTNEMRLAMAKGIQMANDRNLHR